MLLTLGQAFFIIVLLLTPTIGSLIILQQTGSIALAGLASSITWGGRIAIAYHSGRLMDKVGRAKVLVLGFLLAIVGTLIIAVGTVDGSFPLFTTGLIVLGLGQGVIQQNRLAVADMFPPQRRGQAVAYFMTISVAGVLAVPLLINLSSSYAPIWGLNLYAVPWFLSIPILASGLCATLFVKPDPREISEDLRSYYPDYHPTMSAPEKPSAAPLRFVSVVGIFPVLVALSVAATTQGIMTMLMGLTSVYLAHHAVDIESISLSLTIHTIGMYGLSIPFGRMADHYGRKRALLVGLGLSAAGAVLTPITSTYWIITLGIFLIGLGWSAAVVASTSVIADVLGPRARGKGIGVNDVAMGATALSFPIVGGILFEVADFTALGLFGLVATFPALALVLLLKEPRPGVYAHQLQAS